MSGDHILAETRFFASLNMDQIGWEIQPARKMNRDIHPEKVEQIKAVI